MLHVPCGSASVRTVYCTQPTTIHVRAHQDTLGVQLLDAAERGDAAAVRSLLRQGANVRVRDKEGWTPLIRAASRAGLEACRLLLQAGADVNARGKDGETALWAAAGGGDTRLVHLLLDHGARANARTSWHSSALEFAAEMGSLDVVKLLVAHGADLKGQGEGAIDQAVFRGRIDVVRYLIRHGVGVNHARWETGSFPRDMDTGWSLLMIAIKREHTDIAALLISRGADVRVKSKNGMTALKLARREGDDDLVRMLKRAGARE